MLISPANMYNYKPQSFGSKVSLPTHAESQSGFNTVKSFLSMFDNLSMLAQSEGKESFAVPQEMQNALKNLYKYCKTKKFPNIISIKHEAGKRKPLSKVPEDDTHSVHYAYRIKRGKVQRFVTLFTDNILELFEYHGDYNFSAIAPIKGARDWLKRAFSGKIESLEVNPNNKIRFELLHDDGARTIFWLENSCPHSIRKIRPDGTSAGTIEFAQNYKSGLNATYQPVDNTAPVPLFPTRKAINTSA